MIKMPLDQVEEQIKLKGHRATTKQGAIYCSNDGCKAFGVVGPSERRLQLFGGPMLSVVGPIVRLECPVNSGEEKPAQKSPIYPHLQERRTGERRTPSEGRRRNWVDIDRRAGTGKRSYDLAPVRVVRKNDRRHYPSELTTLFGLRKKDNGGRRTGTDRRQG